ncbi:hypothetical protein MMC13_001755 [Lambiella insularis]|nr:hypothetical protein [Lambiella insularis]
MASLSTAPAKVIHLIFTSLPTLEDVCRLASASRALHHARNTHAHAIYLAVARRSILCFRAADSLLAVQEMIDADKTPLSRPPRPETQEQCNLTALHHMKAITLNARTAAAAFTELKADLYTRFRTPLPPLPSPPFHSHTNPTPTAQTLPPTPRDRRRFFRDHYRHRALAARSVPAEACLLALAGRADDAQLLEIGRWIEQNCSADALRRFKSACRKLAAAPPLEGPRGGAEALEQLTRGMGRMAAGGRAGFGRGRRRGEGGGPAPRSGLTQGGGDVEWRSREGKFEGKF